MIRRSILSIVLPFLAAFLATMLALTLVTAAAQGDGADLSADLSEAEPAPTPDKPPKGIATDLATWWRTGALAAPVAALAFGLLVGLEALGRSRWPRTAWLRRGKVQAWMALAIGNLSVMLPAIASGSVTSGGVSVALLGGLLAVRPGGGEQKADERGEAVA